VGGDGTIHDIVNGIAGFAEDNKVKLSEFTLAVIPLGSGNDWARTFGISKNIKSALRLLKDGRVARQDMVKASLLNASGAEVRSRYMVNIAGIGLDARVCEIVNHKKKQGYRGKKLYVSALFYCIKHRVPVAAKVMCDGQTIFDGKYLSMALGTGKYSGGGMRQTPLAVPDDGLIDVTIIPDIPMSVIARKVITLFTGTFHTVKQLTLARGSEVVVLPSGQAAKEPLEVDGEVVGRVPAKFKVLENQLNVMVP
jgi:YegS/Rv2252/BmrU family lipid kinase